MPERLLENTQDHSGGMLHDASGDVVQTVYSDELDEGDRVLAARFGYKPVFRREFTYLSTFSFAVSIGGLFSSVATTFIYPLQAGGSAAIVWCAFLCLSACCS